MYKFIMLSNQQAAKCIKKIFKYCEEHKDFINRLGEHMSRDAVDKIVV